MFFLQTDSYLVSWTFDVRALYILDIYYLSLILFKSYKYYHFY